MAVARGERRRVGGRRTLWTRDLCCAGNSRSRARSDTPCDTRDSPPVPSGPCGLSLRPSRAPAFPRGAPQGSGASPSARCALGPELHPGELALLHFDAAKYALPADCDAEHVLSGWHVGDTEVLVIDGIGVIARAIGLDERERRFVRLRFHDAVDARLG